MAMSMVLGACIAHLPSFGQRQALADMIWIDLLANATNCAQHESRTQMNMNEWLHWKRVWISDIDLCNTIMQLAAVSRAIGSMVELIPTLIISHRETIWIRPNMPACSCSCIICVIMAAQVQSAFDLLDHSRCLAIWLGAMMGNYLM